MSEARRGLVYLIQCHNSASYLADLFACLHTQADFYIINVDSKSSAGLRTLAAMLGSTYPNVHVLPIEPISWGGFSQAEIVLRAVDALPSFGDGWSHLVVLSEQHLPLASPAEIAARLPPGQSLIPYNQFADLWPTGRADVQHRFSMSFQELPGVGPLIKARSSINEDFYERLYHSSNWFVLARNACERLCARDEDAALLRLFASCTQPDEMLVPTMLLGYPRQHELAIVKRNASFLASPHLGGAPGLIFTEQNFNAAVNENYLFIRKRPEELPQSVAEYLDRHTGLNDPCYREVRELAARLDAEPSGHRYRDEVIDHFVAFADGVPGIEMSDFSRSGFRNIPALYVVFKSPSWHKDVKVAVLSEDFRHFKVVLVWNDPFQKSFESKTIGPFDAVIIRARVHGLAFSREIFIEDKPDGGFLDIGSAGSLANVEDVVARHFAVAPIFSQHLVRHEKLETGGRLIDKPKYEFLREQVHKVKGWLNDYAAIRTIELLDWQEAQGMTGPVLEIGVFSGRYFSILLRSAARAGSVAVGVDTFQWVSLDTVRKSLAPIEGSEAAIFLSQPSTYLSGADLLSALGAKPRFFSIDGSHECDDVVWDLRLGEEILAPEGLISVDDFLNPVTLGVNEGVNRFFSQPRNLAPVAYTDNKLFLARPFFAGRYRQAFEAFVVADEIEKRSEQFRKQLALGRDKVEGRLWGHPILFVP